MRIARKVYMSIFTTLFILITCVATTFAWVGMLTTSTLGSFDLNIKSQEIDADYFLKISNSGVVGTFKESLNLKAVKREILENMGYDTSSVTDDGISDYFASKAIMEPVTTDSSLSNFYSMKDLKKSTPYLDTDDGYFKFDLYLSVDTLNEIANLTTAEINALDINANVFFENIETALFGTPSTGSLVNENPFSSIPSNSDYECLNNINAKSITVNTKNATRLAFQIYSPININASYSGSETPVNTIIYQGGSQLPSATNNYYDLGGILPEEYNLALKEINTIYGTSIDLDTLYVSGASSRYLGAYNRYINSTDLEMTEYSYSVTSDIVDGTNFSSYYILSNDEYVSPTSFSSTETYYTRTVNNKIWQAPTTISGTNYLGIKGGVQTKMKITVYFWYEGYDADCLQLIDFRNAYLDILFATDKNSN